MQRSVQIYSFFLIALPVLFLFGCSKNKFDVDVSGIEAPVSIKRFDKDLFAINPLLYKQDMLKLERKYASFYQLYIENIMRFGSVSDTAYLRFIPELISNRDYLLLKSDCDSVYPDLKNIESDFSDAFKHYLYYFPGKPLPEVVSFISGFNVAIPTGDSVLGIGLDMFLGKDYRFYPSIGLPQYLMNKLTKEHLLPTAMKGFAKSNFEEGPDDKTLLAKMIYEGKILYFLDAMLPEIHDTLKIGYTGKQLTWCNEYEIPVWSNFIDKKLLYSSDELEYAKYLNEAPFTNGLDKDSAPMLGVWTGWQIVRKYMDKHPEISLAQLMAEHDAQKILKESKYKPG